MTSGPSCTNETLVKTAYVVIHTVQFVVLGCFFYLLL